MDWTNLPPLTALRAFAAYADTGAMAEAGARLNVSHAAISQQIKALEDHLGLSLLDRARGGGALTPEGRAVADATLTGLFDIATLCAELTGRDADRPLHISTTPSFASACSLFSPMGDFNSQKQAVDVAEAVMQALFLEENRAETDRSADIRASREAEVAAQEEAERAKEEAEAAANAPTTEATTRRQVLTAGLSEKAD